MTERGRHERPFPSPAPGPDRLVPKRFALTGILLAVAIVGLVLSVIGYLVNPAQFAYSWFFGFYFFFTIALGSFFWVTLHYACDSDWSVVVRRVWENILALLPLFLLLFIPIGFLPELRQTLWQWMQPVHAHDHALALRAGYLNLPFFYARGRALLRLLYPRRTLVLEELGPPGRRRRSTPHPPDARSQLPRAGHFRHAGNFPRLRLADGPRLALVLEPLRRLQLHRLRPGEHGGNHRPGRPPARGRPPEDAHPRAFLPHGQAPLRLHHLLGLHRLRPVPPHLVRQHPEETIFYNDHNRGGWRALSFCIIVGKFILPTIYLLAQDTKKSLRALTLVAVWILFMHGVELYWFIMPYAHQGEHPAELAGLHRLPHRRLDPRLRLSPGRRPRLALPDPRPAPGRMPSPSPTDRHVRPHRFRASD